MAHSSEELENFLDSDIVGNKGQTSGSPMKQSL